MSYGLETLPGRIKYARARKGMNQTELASAYSGRVASCTHVCLWETGKGKPRNFPKLAECLGVRVDWLMTGLGQMEA